MPDCHARIHRVLARTLFILILTSSLAFAQEHTNRDYEVAITKGVLQIETTNYPDAIDSFKKALVVKPRDKTATINLGIAYGRSGNLTAARDILLKAFKDDSRDARLRYELGIVLYKIGEQGEAKKHFLAAIEGTSDGTIRSGAREYLDLIAPAGSRDSKPFSLNLLGGFQYDSNVILEPNNPSTTGQRKKDWRAVLTVDGDYRFLQSEKTTATAGYQFYQSVHQKLHDYNIQQHSPRLAVTQELSGTTKVGIKYTFSYALAGGTHFSSTNETMPFVAVNFTPASLTEFHFICNKTRFHNSTLFPLNAEQSGTDRTGGILHTIKVGAGSNVTIGYDYDANDANERYWSYRGNKGSLGFQSTVGIYTASLAASYYDQKYREVMSGYTEKRHDGTQEYSIDLSRAIDKDLSLVLSDLYTVHDSNLTSYEYTRNIVGLFVVMRL